MHLFPDGGNMFYKKISSQYRMISKKGEGTFSEVLKAQCLKTNKYVAIKCMKNTFDNLEQVTNLREIQALQRLSPHANIVKLIEVLYDQPTGKLALVFELMDMNIYELIRGRRTYVSEERIKCYMYQLIKAMDHMHRNGIFHRDIKPENILIMDEVLKLADFGSCRGVYSKQPYTEYISTRWYRAPECLLTDGYYTYKMDMWGVGCVFFEILSLFPLFPGNNELDQIQRIHKVLGTPPPQLLEKMRRRSRHADFSFPPQDGTGIARLIPHASPACIEIINKLLAYNPDDRWSARQALRHIYFKELRDRDKLQQGLLNGGTRSLHPSPRLSLHDLLCKSRASDVGKQSLADRTNVYGDPSTNTSPVSLASGVSHLPSLSTCIKFKESDKATSRSTPVSQIGEMLSPAGSSLSMYASPDGANSYRDMEESNVVDAPAALPPIKGTQNHPMIPPKVPFGQSSNVTNVQRSNRAQASKTTKNIKGTKNHRNLPELSPKGSHKPGEPPPYKKRANNTKYVSPYSQRSMSQSPSIY